MTHRLILMIHNLCNITRSLGMGRCSPLETRPIPVWVTCQIWSRQVLRYEHTYDLAGKKWTIACRLWR